MEDSSKNENEKQQINNEPDNCAPVECIPEDLNDALKELPDEQKKKALHSILLFMRRSIFPATNPLLDKLDTTLLGKMIDNSENESVRDYEQSKFDRISGIVVLIIVLFTVSMLLFIFRHHIDDIRDFLMPIIYIAVGAVGGYGYRSINENKQP